MAYIGNGSFQAGNFSDLSGGINISRPPDLIGENECEEAVNIEFDFSRTKVRGGLSAPISTYLSDIQSVFYIPYSNTGVVVLQDGSVYEDDLNGAFNLVGTLTGTKRPSFCRYDNKTFIASGGKLQYVQFPGSGSSTEGVRITVNSIVSSYDDENNRLVVDGSVFTATSIGENIYRVAIVSSSSTTHSLTTIADSPNCSIVFERAGRLVVANAGSDRIHYSAIGNPYNANIAPVIGTENPQDEGWYEKDATTGVYSKTEDTTVVSGKTYYSDCGGWQDDSNDDSSAKWIDVGYKADGNIISIVPMSSDLFVFKDGGTVYSLSSEYPNWTIAEVTKNTDITNSHCVSAVPNSVAYLCGRGLFGISSTDTYGNFSIAELGNKINKGISYKCKQPRVYSLTRKSQLLLCPNTVVKPNELWCYHWNIAATTQIVFPESVGKLADIADTIDGPIVALGNKLFRWSDTYQDDNGTPITSKITTREVIAPKKIFTRRVIFGTEAHSDTSVNVTIGKESFATTFNNRWKTKEIYTNGRSMKITIETTGRYSLNELLFYYSVF